MYEVRVQAQADLLVFKSSSMGLARGKDHVWYEVRSPGQADVRVYKDTGINQADVLVYYVNTVSMAGWRTNHKLKGKIG